MDKTRDEIISRLWSKSNRGTEFWEIEEAFNAGAEYMRQECIKKVYGMCESDNVAARTVEAIRKIEA